MLQIARNMSSHIIPKAERHLKIMIDFAQNGLHHSLSFFFSFLGGGPSIPPMSAVTSQVCDVLGEDNPTIVGELGVDAAIYTVVDAGM